MGTFQDGKKLAVLNFDAVISITPYVFFWGNRRALIQVSKNGPTFNTIWRAIVSYVIISSMPKDEDHNLHKVSNFSMEGI